MKVINLSDLDSSDIKYKISQFPDGQQDIVIIGIEFWEEMGDYNPPTKILSKKITKDIEIKSRFNSFKDLELIICTTKALRRLGVKEISLYIPYLLGSRSDRQFQEGGNSYLVDVIAPIINSLEFKQVTTIDIHSDVAAACIKNLKVISNLDLVKFAFNSIKSSNSTIISPDAGAEKKIYNILPTLRFIDLITAKKHRDLVTSNILSTEIITNDSHIAQVKPFIIIDDICDGGRTFIEIAKALRNNKISVSSDIYLIVTHGIFSAGFLELSKWFDGIYCTNSIRDIHDYTGNGLVKTKLKQLKVI